MWGNGAERPRLVQTQCWCPRDVRRVVVVCAKHEGQHVYHIIATSNGGPDHTDNYLYALGGSFNIAVGDRFDHLNCFLAGKAKAEKAVAIAIKVANDPSLHMHIEKRGKAKQVTFRDGRHGSIQSGGQLYKMGEDLFRDMRAAAR